MNKYKKVILQVQNIFMEVQKGSNKVHKKLQRYSWGKLFFHFCKFLKVSLRLIQVHKRFKKGIIAYKNNVKKGSLNVNKGHKRVCKGFNRSLMLKKVR